jgi:hypothetical protein
MLTAAADNCSSKIEDKTKDKNNSEGVDNDKDSKNNSLDSDEEEAWK